MFAYMYVKGWVCTGVYGGRFIAIYLRHTKRPKTEDRNRAEAAEAMQ